MISNSNCFHDIRVLKYWCASECSRELDLPTELAAWDLGLCILVFAIVFAVVVFVFWASVFLTSSQGMWIHTTALVHEAAGFSPFHGRQAVSKTSKANLGSFLTSQLY